MNNQQGLLKQHAVAYRREAVKVPVARRNPRRPAPAAGGEPTVDLHRGPDGAVQAITVRCTCGKEITLQCEYLGEGGSDVQ